MRPLGSPTCAQKFLLRRGVPRPRGRSQIPGPLPSGSKLRCGARMRPCYRATSRSWAAPSDVEHQHQHQQQNQLVLLLLHLLLHVAIGYWCPPQEELSRRGTPRFERGASVAAAAAGPRRHLAGSLYPQNPAAWTRRRRRSQHGATQSRSSSPGCRCAAACRWRAQERDCACRDRAAVSGRG